jgi:TfoX N-terminal domain
MKLEKSPPQLVELFDRVVPAAPGVVRRMMFGYPSAVVNGNMFMSLFADGLVLRLGERDRAEIGAEQFEPMPGRPMTGYVIVRGGRLSDRDWLAEWAERSLAHAATLPAKTPKPRKARKGA